MAVQNAVDAEVNLAHKQSTSFGGRFTHPLFHLLNTPISRLRLSLPGLLAAASLVLSLPLARAQTYTVTQLPTLGGTQTTGLAINNSGTVAGDSTLVGDTVTHAITYANGAVVDLGTVPGGTSSYANGINEFGNVVGNSDTVAGTVPQAFESTFSVITDLGTLGGTKSYAFGINESGTIVGNANLSGDTATHAFSYNNGVMTDLGTLGGANSIAYAINSAGTIVGYEEPTSTLGLHRAFSSSKGVMTDLGTLGGTRSISYGINDAGTIVGDAATASGAIHAFSYSGGVMTDLGTIGGATGSSFAYAINSSGVIVGYSAVTGSAVNHSFVYTNGLMADLNSLVTISGVTLTGPPAINDLGQIIANGTDGRAYLLTPASLHLVVSTPTSANQGSVLSVTVSAVDGSGNLATSYGGLVAVSSSDAAAVLPASKALTNGTASFAVTLKTTGVQTITASDTVIPSVTGTSAPITVIHVIPPGISVKPLPQSVNVGANAVFWAVATGSAPLTYQWNFNGVPIAGATSPLLQDVSVAPLGAGSFTLTVSNTGGSVTSAPVTLSLNSTGSGNPLHFVSQPIAQSAAGASRVVLSALTAGSDGGPPATYQWFQNGVALSGATGPELVIAAAGASNSGTYLCAAMNSSGALLSNQAALTVLGGVSTGRLSNLSCRSAVGAGASQLIAGFVLGGQGTAGGESVLVRASGPALTQFGVAGVLADPQLTLYSLGGPVASNSGWGGNTLIASTATALGAFPWTSASSHDSALVEPLPGGSYTAQVSGSSGDSGIALAEVYDATPEGSVTSPSPRLINLSARAQVGSGGNILIAGFVIGGTTSKTVLIRGSGPALSAFGVAGFLPDPELKVYEDNNDGTSTLLAVDAGWGGDAQVASAAASVGAFSWGYFGTPDSAVLVSLPPGAYTAQVSGVSGDQGVALVEIYEVP